MVCCISMGSLCWMDPLVSACWKDLLKDLLDCFHSNAQLNCLFKSNKKPFILVKHSSFPCWIILVLFWDIVQYKSCDCWFQRLWLVLDLGCGFGVNAKRIRWLLGQGSFALILWICLGHRFSGNSLTFLNLVWWELIHTCAQISLFSVH